MLVYTERATACLVQSNPGASLLKISATLQPLLDSIRRETPSLLQQLRVGQTLQARVTEQIEPGLLKLRIAQESLLARSQLAARPGTTLKLEVIKGLPLPELRVVREPVPQSTQQQVIRTAIGRQQAPGEVREAVTALRTQPLPAKAAEVLQRLERILQSSGVPLKQLSPATIQRAVATSGILHEARLANPLPTPIADHKAQLLQLLALIRPDIRLEDKAPRAQPAAEANPGAPATRAGDGLISRLLRLIEGSVTRIQLQQAAALPQEEGQRQAWQIDLPIHLPDESSDMMLRIERECHPDEQGGRDTWAVNLAFDFDTIGRLQCRIALLDERVSTTFWCERAALQTRLERQLPTLREALEAQGLEVVHLAGVVGEPPEPLINVPKPDALLDEHV